MIFLHLTDAKDDTAVRIRMDLIEALYIHEETQSYHAFQGGAVATAVKEPYTMVVYSHGSAHGVRESIGDIEGQMADAYELAGIAAL